MNEFSNLLWMLDLLPNVHGGHDGGEGLVGLLDEFLTLLSGGFKGGVNPFGGLMLLGTNIHPMLIHFPIAFLSTYVLLDFVGLSFGRHKLRALGSSLLTIGFLGCVLSVAAGLYAASTAPHGPIAHGIMIWHQRSGYLVLAVSALLTVWRLSAGIPRDSMKNTLGQFLNLILLGAVLAAADLGAALVYGQGVAVHAIEKAQVGLHHHD